MEIIETIPKLQTRKSDAHKGNFGKICIIGGSIGFSGTAALTGYSPFLLTSDRSPWSAACGGYPHPFDVTSAKSLLGVF